LAKSSVNQSRHVRPEKKIDELCGSRFLKKTRDQIAHCMRPISVSRKSNLRAV